MYASSTDSLSASKRSSCAIVVGTGIYELSAVAMKLNQDTILLTPNLMLVPYEPHHVPKYHGWMQSAELLEQVICCHIDLL